eukprot:2225043-Rhodomonas_salina.4
MALTLHVLGYQHTSVTPPHQYQRRYGAMLWSYASWAGYLRQHIGPDIRALMAPYATSVPDIA